MPSAATKRQRRHRDRLRAGVRIVWLECDDALRDELIERGVLGEWDEENKAAIAEAILRAARLGLSYPVTRDTPGIGPCDRSRITLFGIVDKDQNDAS